VTRFSISRTGAIQGAPQLGGMVPCQQALPDRRLAQGPLALRNPLTGGCFRNNLTTIKIVLATKSAEVAALGSDLASAFASV
jgi:hypothetical protein